MTGRCVGDSRPLDSIEIRRGNAVMETPPIEGNTAEYTIDSVDCLYSGSYECVVINGAYPDNTATQTVALVAHCES